MRTIEYEIGNGRRTSIDISEEDYMFWATFSDDSDNIVQSIDQQLHEDILDMIYRSRGLYTPIIISRGQNPDEILRELFNQVCAIKKHYKQEKIKESRIKENRSSLKAYRSSSRKQKQLIKKCSKVIIMDKDMAIRRGFI